jgi:hypothetical protein
MTRILLIETASAKRICEKLRQILASKTYPDPEISVLCAERNRPRYREFPVTVWAVTVQSRRRIEEELAQKRFDVIFAFWTGEKRARRWKLLPIRLKPREAHILSGDGNEFRLTWKAIIRHSIFRLRHALPTDHWEYQEPESDHEKILVVQSAEPPYVLNGLDRLMRKPLFLNPRFTLFCRNLPEIEGIFRDNPVLAEIITHSEARNSWEHLRFLRRQRFDGIVLFLTGDPSYWKVKLFAFLLGTRRILIFNEFNDCFFFNFHQWLLLISRTISAFPKETGSRWSHSTRILLSLALKSVSLPFRFAWLLLVWLRLRIAGLICSRNSHDYPV